MLRLIPAPLHRQLYRLAHALRSGWWHIRRPRRSSVVVIAFNADGQVLVVRHSYGPPVWSLPGGGIGRGEDPAEGARREVREELRCGLADLVQIDASDERISGSIDRQHVFTATVVGEPQPDMREIVEVAFADPSNLLERCGRRSRRRIEQALALRGAGSTTS